MGESVNSAILKNVRKNFRPMLTYSDEAHRGQYGLDEKVKMVKNEDGEEEAKIVIGTARIIRNALPNATYIGFTGTPISTKDKSTREVFGDYIDIYDMTQAVEDGATRPVYYETNVVKSEKFSEIIQRALNAYLNGMLTNEEVIAELLKMAKEINNARKEGDDLGLTKEEMAFYDALTKPEAIKDFYENAELVALTKELTETLRSNKTVD